METFAGKVAVITGAGSGIGRGIAGAFSREGMRLVLAGRRADPLQAVVGELRDQGVECVAAPTDVADAAAVQRLAQTTLDTYGAAHVLCNNAGINLMGRQWELSTDDWEAVIGTDLWGVIHGVRAFVPHMLASGQQCHLVNTASMGGLLSTPFMGPYAAAKHAVVGLTKALRAELGGTNVGVTLLCPGTVRTPMVGAMRTQMASSTTAPDPAINALLDAVDDGLQRADAMSSNEVGRQVVAAIRANQFWLLSNGAAMVPLVRFDHDEMVAGANEC